MQKRERKGLFLSILCLCLITSCCNGQTKAQEVGQMKGAYIQIGLYNEEPILWRVLDVTNQKLLLITDKVISAGAYGTSEHASVNVEWHKSLLRKWLNSIGVEKTEGFYNTAFQEKEKNIMAPIQMGNVSDKIFILTYYDILKYFPKEKDRQVMATPKAQLIPGYSGYSVYTREGYATWWTRTPAIGDSMMCIGPYGKRTISKSLFVNAVGIRPSIVIDQSKIYSMQGSGTKDDPYRLGKTEGSNSEKEGELPPWQKDKEYRTGDRVLYRGKNYKCLQGHTSLENWAPETAPALWIEMKQEGTWVAGTNYNIADVVEVKGKTYKCIQAHTALDGWQPEKAPALWEKIK